MEVPLSYSPKTCKSHDDSSANTGPDQSDIGPNYEETQELLASNFSHWAGRLLAETVPSISKCATDNACLFVWATVVGIGISYVMVHNRWIKVAWRPRVVVGDSRQTGGEPCGDR